MKLVESEKPVPPPLTDTDIVVGLRSDDVNRRRAALDALFPHGAVLIATQGTNVVLGITASVDAGRIFNGLLYMAEQIGKLLGLKLGWVPDPEAGSKLVIAPPGAMR